MGEQWVQKTFDVFSFGGRQPQLVYSEKPAEEAKSPDRVRTNLTSIELYQRIFNRINRGTNFKDAFNQLNWLELIHRNEQKTYWGTELHKAETIYNLQTQGCAGDRDMVGIVLPTAHRKDLEFYADITRGLAITDDLSMDEKYDRYVTAWHRYLQKRERYPSATIPLLNHWGFSNPVDIHKYLRDPQLQRYGEFLAGIWADEVHRNSHELGWEFSNKYITYNEVLFMINIEGIQWLFRIDNISRPNKSKGKLATRMTNFKTSKFKSQDPEGMSIMQRQKQLELWAGEWFTAEVIKGQYQLPQTNGAPFNIVTSAFNRSAVGRTSCSWRTFEYNDLKMDNEEVRMSTDERVGFEKWLFAYSTMFIQYRNEIRNLNKNLPRLLK